MKYKIKRISRKEISTSKGPATKVGMILEGREGWVGCFENEKTKSWAVGSDIEGDIQQNGEYWNFILPKNGKIDSMAGADVITELKIIRITLQAMLAKMSGSQEPGEIQTQQEEESPF